MSQSEIERLYRAYGYIIYGRCICLLGNREEARDAMQVVFMKLVQAYDSIRDKERVVPWIFRAAKNHCFNIIRSRRKFVDEVEPDELAGRESAVDRLEEKDLLIRVMQRFGKNIRDAVYYTHVEGLEQREIQRVTGQSPATVRRNLNKFREAVPVVLKRLGIYDV